MMFFSLVTILVVFSLVAFFLVRHFKQRDHGTNRYRHYSQPAPKKANKVRPNRYSHRASRRDTKNEPIEEELVKAVMPVQEPTLEDHDPDVVLGLKEPASVERRAPIPTEAQITLKPPPPPPPITVFHLMAADNNPYNGYELMQAILSVGMRFGKKQIFHRHEDKNGRGAILFSLSSLLKPGTFDLHNMGGFSTSGLSLFFRANDVEDPVAVYELMLQTAGQLVEDLAGQVIDERRQLLTPAKVVEQRQLLREYVEGKQVPDFFTETVSE